MQAQRIGHLRAPHDEPAHALHALIGRLRWRVAGERLALFAVRGAIASGLALIAAALIVWLTQSSATFAVLGMAPLLAAVVLALVRWPSRLETAVIADRRLGLEERLATAVELQQRGDQGRFVSRQVRDAIASAESAPRSALVLERSARYELGLATLAMALGLAAVWLVPGLPHPSVAQLPPPLGEALSGRVVAEEQLAQRALPTDAASPIVTLPEPAPVARPAADLTTRVQQEQSQRAALDKLAQALSSVSAGQPAAEAIQQGNFSAAADQLQNLGDNADQLTDAAKQQLAQALQQAAGATAQSDRALADRERQAARALSRSTYSDQRQALHDLGGQLQRSGASSVSAAQLQRDLGQLEQQNAGLAQGQVQDRGPGQATGVSSSQADGQVGASQAQSNLSAGLSGGGGSEVAAQPGSASFGANPDPFSNQPSRLDTAGQQVQVPPKLGVGPGARPATGTEDQSSLADSPLGGQRAAELPRAQQTGQVAPEQNLVPGEQRPVIRGYFR